MRILFTFLLFYAVRGQESDCRYGFLCDNGRCIEAFYFCNGVDQCGDGSEEIQPGRNLTNTSGIACRQYFDDSSDPYPKLCILPLSQVSKREMFCKIEVDCRDGFLCKSGKCIEAPSFCDGDDDCRDGSDEIKAEGTLKNMSGIACRQHFDEIWTSMPKVCILPLSQALKQKLLCKIKIDCSDGFLCDNRKCIEAYDFCDGDVDCGDGSDEIQAKGNSTNTSGIACRQHFDGSWTSIPTVCILPLSQASKIELFCKIKSDCSNDFLCRNGKCIESNSFCDGEDNCGDGSDEIQAEWKFMNTSELACRQNFDNNYSDVYLKLCILPISQSFKRKLLCKLGTDCSYGFLCQTGRCIDASNFCDGTDDCRDGSDEIYAQGNLTNTTGIVCRQHFDYYIYSNPTLCIVPLNQVSKRELLCKIDIDCSEGFLCQNKNCVPKSNFCDGRNDCGDGSDEIQAEGNLTAESGIACRQYFDDYSFDSYPRLCILPLSQASKKKLFCEIENDCSDGFICGSGFCADPNEVCNNGKCSNNDDWPLDLSNRGDRLCSSMHSSWTCALPQKHICDSTSYCEGGIDECLCADGVSQVFLDEKCFRCLRNRTIVVPVSRLCDGFFDCPDLTDECLCDGELRPMLCDDVLWVEEQQEYPFSISCSDNATTLGLEQICDEKTDCENKNDEESCSKLRTKRPRIGDEKEVSTYFCSQTQQNVTACDRISQCTKEVYEEECESCWDKPRFCEFMDPTYGDLSCPVAWVRPSQICDGVAHCESSEDELDCGEWFYCKNETNSMERFTWDKVCDTVEDCADASDEGIYSNCSYFTCNDEGKVKYIANRQICDGTQDCAKGSDECQEECIKSAFSDTKSMIKNEGVVGFAWIISFTAVFGNIFVISHTARVLIKRRNDNQVEKSAVINKTLILNLSVSDLIVGIYTLAIVIQNQRQKGSYCLVDQEWRSSSTCSAIGSLLVIGSQQSVFTMVIITVFRNLGITSKQKYEPSYKKFGLVIIATWIVSVFLAVIPLAPHLENYFIDSVWYKDNNLFTTIDKPRAANLTNWLMLIGGNTNNTNIDSDVGSWAMLEMWIAKLNQNLTVQRRFGFYSTHAVCLPTFFPNKNTDTAWWYSVLIISINFVSFVAVFVGSVNIYRTATAPSMALKKHTLQKRAAAMQVKLSRIVITDFLCWMPVCIMGFIQLSGFDISNDAYIPIALIVIPINSSLNPFLYSNVPDIMWAKLKSFYFSKCGSSSAPGARGNRRDLPSGRVIEMTNL